MSSVGVGGLVAGESPQEDSRETGVPNTQPDSPDWDEAVEVVEWFVEAEWVDHVKAGAAGPTSTYGPFVDLGHRDRFTDGHISMDRSVARHRLLRRSAIYTPQVPVGEWVSVSEDERNALYEATVSESLRRRNALP
jgi:hypothetical protein